MAGDEILADRGFTLKDDFAVLVTSRKEELSVDVPNIEKNVIVCCALINLSPGIVYSENK